MEDCSQPGGHRKVAHQATQARLGGVGEPQYQTKNMDTLQKELATQGRKHVLVSTRSGLHTEPDKGNQEEAETETPPTPHSTTPIPTYHPIDLGFRFRPPLTEAERQMRGTKGDKCPGAHPGTIDNTSYTFPSLETCIG